MLTGYIIDAINIATDVYFLLLLVRVIFSWVRVRRPHRVLRAVERMCFAATEPLLRPIRNALFRYQRGVPVDFSPIIAGLIIIVVRNLLVRLLRGV